MCRGMSADLDRGLRNVLTPTSFLHFLPLAGARRLLFPQCVRCAAARLPAVPAEVGADVDGLLGGPDASEQTALLIIPGKFAARAIGAPTHPQGMICPGRAKSAPISCRRRCRRTASPPGPRRACAG